MGARAAPVLPSGVVERLDSARVGEPPSRLRWPWVTIGKGMGGCSSSGRTREGVAAAIGSAAGLLTEEFVTTVCGAVLCTWGVPLASNVLAAEGSLPTATPSRSSSDVTDGVSIGDGPDSPPDAVGSLDVGNRTGVGSTERLLEVRGS